MSEDEIAKVFPSLEADLVKEIAAVADVRNFEEGAVLIRTGQNIKSALLVIDGIVKIYREDEGHEFFIYYLEAGKACAISLVCSLGTDTSTLRARAMTRATVLSLPVRHVDAWMGKYKSWAQFAVTTYRERFDNLLQTIDHIAFRQLDERLLFYLRQHREKFNSNRIPLSFTQIATDLNSSREVISRLMKKLSERGIVQLHGSYIEITNLQEQPL